MHRMEVWNEINRITPVKEGQGVFTINASVFDGFSIMNLALFDKETDFATFDEYCNEANYGKDIKMNHRFLNSQYHTLSQKAGRKLSKIGYSFVDSIESLNKKHLLCARIENKSGVVIYMIPIQISLTKDLPVGSCELWISSHKWNKIRINTYYQENNGWSNYLYYSNINLGVIQAKQAKKLTLKQQHIEIPNTSIVKVCDMVQIKSSPKNGVLVL